MAVRGVVTIATFYEKDRTPSSLPVYDQQNYFIDGYTLYGDFLAYNQFTGSPITMSKDGLTQSFSLTYPATTANINLVEEAIDNYYQVFQVRARWSDNEGLENPTNLNIAGLAIGYAIGGSSDYTTVTLEVETYSETVNADFPGKKIPWTILSPLSFQS